MKVAYVSHRADASRLSRSSVPTLTRMEHSALSFALTLFLGAIAFAALVWATFTAIALHARSRYRRLHTGRLRSLPRVVYTEPKVHE